MKNKKGKKNNNKMLMNKNTKMMTENNMMTKNVNNQVKTMNNKTAAEEMQKDIHMRKNVMIILRIIRMDGRRKKKNTKMKTRQLM